CRLSIRATESARASAHPSTGVTPVWATLNAVYDRASREQAAERDERKRPAAEPARPDVDPRAAHLLTLQRQAGNQAVVAMLGRDPIVPVQRLMSPATFDDRTKTRFQRGANRRFFQEVSHRLERYAGMPQEGAP